VRGGSQETISQGGGGGVTKKGGRGWKTERRRWQHLLLSSKYGHVSRIMTAPHGLSAMKGYVLAINPMVPLGFPIAGNKPV